MIEFVYISRGMHSQHHCKSTKHAKNCIFSPPSLSSASLPIARSLTPSFNFDYYWWYDWCRCRCCCCCWDCILFSGFWTIKSMLYIIPSVQPIALTRLNSCVQHAQKHFHNMNVYYVWYFDSMSMNTKPSGEAHQLKYLYILYLYLVPFLFLSNSLLLMKYLNYNITMDFAIRLSRLWLSLELSSPPDFSCHHHYHHRHHHHHIRIHHRIASQNHLRIGIFMVKCAVRP